MSELYLLLLLLAAATGFGLYRKWSDGRTRVDGHHLKISGELVGADLGERATLLQFSSAFCAPCRATKAVLGPVADAVPGVVHVEVDAEANLDLVQRLDIHRTPTTLVVDAAGRVRNRVVGVPRQEELLAVLASALDSK